MFRNLFNARLRAHGTDTIGGRTDWSLQLVLWTLWTFAVVAVGYFNWHADIIAQRPINILGLVIHCALTGAIGLVVLTLVEMRAEPWWFYDEE